jgi:hypothetical protein
VWRQRNGLGCVCGDNGERPDMNEHQTAPDQTDEDILTDDVSDEALEVAGTEGINPTACLTSCFRFGCVPRC